MPNQTTIPPHNLEAERSGLGSLLIEKDSIIKIADILKPEDFYYDHNKIIYEGVLDLFGKRTPIDILTLSTLLKDQGKLDIIGGNAYLTELVNEVVTASHIIQYALIVKQKSTLRNLITAGHDIKSLGFKENDDIDELIDQAEKALFSVSQSFIKDKFVHIKDILDQTY